MKLAHLAFAAATLVAFLSGPLQQGQQQRGPKVPQVGDRLPAFRLNDHEGNAVKIGGKSKGWTIVAFYPKALTPG